jgi:hypothetical protein
MYTYLKYILLSIARIGVDDLKIELYSHRPLFSVQEVENIAVTAGRGRIPGSIWLCVNYGDIIPHRG